MNAKWSILYLAMLSVLGGGCARFQPEPISAATNAVNFERRSLLSPSLQAFIATNSAFAPKAADTNHFDFDRLYLAALYYHPSLAVARAQWAVALGGNLTAAARLNPTISASPGYDFTATSVGLNPWLPGVTFDVPIETMGKRGYRREQAEHLSESARLNIIKTAWAVRSNLRLALIDFATAEKRAEILGRENDVEGKIIQALKARIEAGAVSQTELTLVTIAQQRILAEQTDARRLLAQSRVNLADAIGVTVDSLEQVSVQFDLNAGHADAALLLQPSTRDHALQSRADILAALADYAASQSALQLEIARQYPDLHFGPYYQFNQGDHQFTLSVSAELPVLNQNQGPIAEARAKRRQSAAAFNALQAKVIADLDRAGAGYQAAMENLDSLNALVSAQNTQAKNLVAQQQAGAAENLDVFNAQLEATAAELILVDGAAKAQQAYGALEDAAQRPLATLAPRSKNADVALSAPNR